MKSDRQSHGLSRALAEGDPVILSTGATATVTESYHAGYTGVVKILLDGTEESEQADQLTLQEFDTVVPEADPRTGHARKAQSNMGETRGPSLRMED